MDIIYEIRFINIRQTEKLVSQLKSFEYVIVLINSYIILENSPETCK